MQTRSITRPFQVILIAAALVLAAAVGAAWASGSTPSPLAGSPAGAAAPATTIDASGSTVDAIVAALSEPAQTSDAALVAPSPAAKTAVLRGAGILRTIIGRTDRAEINVTTADGEKTILYVRGTIASVSATGITITMRDGTSQTYGMDATTRIRAQGKPIAVGDLKTGETALVLGLKSGDSYTAEFVRGLPLARTKTGS